MSVKLHVAKNFQDLLNSETLNRHTFARYSINSLTKAVNAALQNATCAYSNGDEELAYLGYKKFIQLSDILQLKHGCEKGLSKDYADVEKKVHLLQESLKLRYAGEEGNKCRVKRIYSYSGSSIGECIVEENYELENLEQESKPKKDSISMEPNTRGGEDKPEAEEKQDLSETEDNDAEEATWLIRGVTISPRRLSKIMSGDSTFIIMDVRCSKDFQTEHIFHANCINIPEEILHSGITCQKLERLLPVTSVELFKSRVAVDHIILYDEMSTEIVGLGSNHTLHIIESALCKCSDVPLKQSLLILRGGFQGWLHFKKAVLSVDFSEENFEQMTDPGMEIDISNGTGGEAGEKINMMKEVTLADDSQLKNMKSFAKQLTVEQEDCISMKPKVKKSSKGARVGSTNSKTTRASKGVTVQMSNVIVTEEDTEMKKDNKYVVKLQSESKDVVSPKAECKDVEHTTKNLDTKKFLEILDIFGRPIDKHVVKQKISGHQPCIGMGMESQNDVEFHLNKGFNEQEHDKENVAPLKPTDTTSEKSDDSLRRRFFLRQHGIEESKNCNKFQMPYIYDDFYKQSNPDSLTKHKVSTNHETFSCASLVNAFSFGYDKEFMLGPCSKSDGSAFLSTINSPETRRHALSGSKSAEGAVHINFDKTVPPNKGNEAFLRKPKIDPIFSAKYDKDAASSTTAKAMEIPQTDSKQKILKQELPDIVKMPENEDLEQSKRYDEKYHAIKEENQKLRSILLQLMFLLNIVFLLVACISGNAFISVLLLFLMSSACLYFLYTFWYKQNK